MYSSTTGTCTANKNLGVVKTATYNYISADADYTNYGAFTVVKDYVSGDSDPTTELRFKRVGD
jgi:hypothetical protein